jgi:hypothetical protein
MICSGWRRVTVTFLKFQLEDSQNKEGICRISRNPQPEFLEDLGIWGKLLEFCKPKRRQLFLNISSLALLYTLLQ